MKSFVKLSIRTGLSLSLILSAAGCASTSTGPKSYKGDSPEERDALKKADLFTGPNQVRENFQAYSKQLFGWAGIIRDVQLLETDKSVKFAFMIEHRHFDWMDHGGPKPYKLFPNGEGYFKTGWIIRKPTDVNRLIKQVEPGNMMLTYGTLHSMKKGVIRLNAEFVHPIPSKKYMIQELVTKPASKSISVEPTETESQASSN